MLSHFIPIRSLVASFTLICSAAFATPLFATELTYSVTVHPDNPEMATITVDTQSVSPFMMKRSLGTPKTQKNPAITVYCADDKRIIQYKTSEQCNKVFWYVPFTNVTEKGINALSLEEKNIYFDDNQWIMTEWESFPRFYNIAGPIAARVCLPDYFCQPLIPNTGGYSYSPALFIWGVEPFVIQLDNFTIYLYSDRTSEQIDKTNVLFQLRAIFNYIAEVFPSANQFKTVWELIWIKNESAYNGGLAFYQSAIANYQIKDGKITSKSVPLLLEFSAHEFVHIANPYHLPQWIEESIAEYYTYKSLYVTGYSDMTACKMWYKKAPSARYADTGLYYAAEQLKNGNENYRRLVYDKGSAFWCELDLLLNQNQVELRQLIPFLAKSLAKQQPASLKLPADFIQKLYEYISADDVDRLLQRYLY